jgi:uncharacterized protein DUF3617
MKTRILMALSALGLATAAWATDILVNSGRWEVTSLVDYGPNRPRGLPPSEKATEIHCLAKQVGLDAKAPLPLAAVDCKLGNYRKEGSVVKFTAVCEEGTLDYAVESTSTTFKGTAFFKSKDPSLLFTVRFEGKRTGPSCSAAELEKYEQN